MNIFDNNKAKRMRIDKKLTQADVAATLGIASNVLAQYERGIVEPDKSMVVKLAEILGCVFQDLIRYDVVIVEKSPLDYNEIFAFETMFQKIGDVPSLTSVQAQSFLQDLCQLAVPVLMNKIEYEPVNFSDVPYDCGEKTALKDAEYIVAKIKALMYDLGEKCPYTGMPLMHEVVLPVLKQGYEIPLVNTLNDSLKKLHRKKRLLLPDFSDCETMVVLSDYGGDSGKDSYKTYSFLFADFHSIATVFNCSMQSIRRKYFTEWPEKEIAFKQKTHPHIKKSLWEYLCAADNGIHGLLVTLIIDHQIKGLFGDIKTNASLINEQSGLEWKPKVLEKLVRVSTVIAYFLNLLGHTGQKLFWLTDDDSIIENEKKANMASQTIVNMTSIFKCPVFFDKVGYGKCSDFRKEETGPFVDALSLTDIVGGSINRYLTRENKVGQDFEIEEQVDVVCKWLTQQGASLNRLSLLFRPDEKNKNIYRAGAFNFALKPGESMPGEVKYLDIEYPTRIV